MSRETAAPEIGAALPEVTSAQPAISTVPEAPLPDVLRAASEVIPLPQATATTAKTADEIAQDVRQLPVTWAGVAYLRHHVPRLPLLSLDVEMTIALWIGFRAVAEQSSWELAHPNSVAAPIAEYVAYYYKRIFGFDSYGPACVFYEEQRSQLMRLERDGSYRRILIRSETMSVRAHLHELRSSLCYQIRFDSKIGKTFIEIDNTIFSLWNKALTGSRRALAMLGVPLLERIDYPAAFLDDDARITDDGVVELRRVGKLRAASEQLDVVAYFEDLRVRGVLPFDTEEDVRRFVVVLALPLIRIIAKGLLGVAWVLGSPGAGKDFVGELAPDLWRAAMELPTIKSKFDLDCGKDELELKRSMSQAGGALYGRAKEAAKRGEAFITTMIRLGGTDQVPARAMRENEVEIANTFVILADSAEDLPDRREIYRRTLAIRVRRLNDDALGEARAEVMSRAAEIIASLRRIVESRSLEYYTQQRGTNGRPVGQVALARLFGVRLDAVVGRNLDEVWDGFADYINSYAAPIEAQRCAHQLSTDKRVPEDLRSAIAARVSPAASVEAIARSIPTYRLSAIMAALTDRLSVHHTFFGNFRSGSGVVQLIKRETDYDREIRERGYLRIDVYGVPYALRLIRDDRFVLWMPEDQYRIAMGLDSMAGHPCPDAPTREPEPPADAVNNERLTAMVTSLTAHIPARPRP